MITMRGIPSHLVPMYWPQILENLNRALSHSEDMDLAEVRAKLLTTEMQLWLIEDDGELKSVLVTELKPPIIRFLLLGGDDVEDWIEHLVETAGQFGAEHGCDFIEVVGREGWRKIGRKLGFQHVYTIYRKEINHGQQGFIATESHDSDDDSRTAIMAGPLS